MRANLASICLRLGLAFVLVSAAVYGFIVPTEWVGFLPKIAFDVFPSETLIALSGLYQALLAVFILLKKKAGWPSILASITFLCTALANLDDFGLVFREMGLALASLALYFVAKIKA